jgi:hypothetical protein
MAAAVVVFAVSVGTNGPIPTGTDQTSMVEA